MNFQSIFSCKVHGTFKNSLYARRVHTCGNETARRGIHHSCRENNGCGGCIRCIARGGLARKAWSGYVNPSVCCTLLNLLNVRDDKLIQERNWRSICIPACTPEIHDNVVPIIVRFQCLPCARYTVTHSKVVGIHCSECVCKVGISVIIQVIGSSWNAGPYSTTVIPQ